VELREWKDDSRSKRNGRQWIQSAIDYCDWRAGSWRRLSDRAQRENLDRWWYLDAARTLKDVLLGCREAQSLHIALPVLNAAPAITPEAEALAQQPRAWLADALLAANPRMTNRKLLLHLGRPKLARLLLEARAAAKPLRRTA